MYYICITYDIIHFICYDVCVCYVVMTMSSEHVCILLYLLFVNVYMLMYNIYLNNKYFFIYILFKSYACDYVITMYILCAVAGMVK